ncbi:MAG TPA: hypothetical protein VMA72_18655 [Streptosporangiaceae bacterium]|nr:hypothetical protein [Streptosporangiaceae bacterium]
MSVEACGGVLFEIVTDDNSDGLQASIHGIITAASDVVAGLEIGVGLAGNGRAIQQLTIGPGDAFLDARPAESLIDQVNGCTASGQGPGQGGNRLGRARREDASIAYGSRIEVPDNLAGNRKHPQLHGNLHSCAAPDCPHRARASHHDWLRCQRP